MARETLKGADVYSAITLTQTKMAYKAGSKLEGQHYHVGRWGSRGFTCSTEFYKDWMNGDISSVTLEESEYEAVDPNTGQKIMRQSATIMGYVTFKRQINLVEKMSDLEVAEAKAEITKKHARVVAIANLNIDAKDLELLEKFA